MARAISSEHLAINALGGMIGDPAPKVLHGIKSLPGIFKGASAGEKAAGKACLDQHWLEPTGEFVGKGKSRKELYRITAAGVQAVLAGSDPSELLRKMQESLQQLGARTQSIPQLVEQKVQGPLVTIEEEVHNALRELGANISEALAPIASLPGVLQSLQSSIDQTVARFKLPDLDELTRKLSQASASSRQEHSPSSPTPAANTGEWREEVVRMVKEQKLHNAFQWLTLPQIYERLRQTSPADLGPVSRRAETAAR